MLNYIKEVLRIHYKNSIDDYYVHVPSRDVYFDLIALYSNELVSLGYDIDSFSSQVMDEEIERLGGQSINSSIGMDWELNLDGDNSEYYSYNYWIEWDEEY